MREIEVMLILTLFRVSIGSVGRIVPSMCPVNSLKTGWSWYENEFRSESGVHSKQILTVTDLRTKSDIMCETAAHRATRIRGIRQNKNREA